MYRVSAVLVAVVPKILYGSGNSVCEYVAIFTPGNTH